MTRLHHHQDFLVDLSSSIILSLDTFSTCDSRCLRCASSWATRSWASTSCFSCDSFARASCNPCGQTQRSDVWTEQPDFDLHTKYTLDPSKATGIIPGIMSLYHSECFEFADVVCWVLYARRVPALKRTRLAALPS